MGLSPTIQCPHGENRTVGAIKNIAGHSGFGFGVPFLQGAAPLSAIFQHLPYRAEVKISRSGEVANAGCLFPLAPDA